jgi:hypothetical protein
VPKVSEVDQVIGELESQLVIISEAIRLLKTAKASKKPAAVPKRAKLKKVEKPSEAAS